MMPASIAITMFQPGSFRTNPQVGTLIVDEPRSLARWASTPIVTADKAEGGGFSLAAFEGGERKKAKVEGVYALGLDVDDGSLSVARAAEVFAPYWLIAYSTHSSTDELPKTRVILLFDRPLTGEEYSVAWRVVAIHMSSLGVTLDRSTKDPSRLWYLPAVKPGARYDYAHHEGKPISADDLVKTARELEAEEEATRQERAKEAARHGAGATSDAYVRGAIVRASDAVASAGKGDRHYMLCKEAWSLARFGLTESEIASALVPSFIAAAGEGRRREAEKAVRDAVKAARVAA